MATDALYLHAIMPSLPTEIAQKIRSLCTSPANEIMLENLVRFLSGAEHAADASKGVQDQWLAKQTATKEILVGLSPAKMEKKRTREDDAMEDIQQAKKSRTSPPPTPSNTAALQDVGQPSYTLHALSATSPVRKKVDITITKKAITMTNPTSNAMESMIPISSIKRAFIVPTRGKSKPHWTVILLSSDIPDKSKPTPGVTSDNQQVIFGIDATPAAPFSTTSYIAASEPRVEVSPKGTATLPFLQDFLMHLSIPVIVPSTDAFKSVCTGIGSSASASGIPGIEAHRAAKSGNLWFAKEGILWGEGKPCEFWPVEDLLGRSEGLRVIGSGRMCTVVLTRRSMTADDIQEGEEDMGEETEFGMVDAKEREGINEWVRAHRHLFGRAPGAPLVKEDEKGEKKDKVVNSGPMTIKTLMDASDSEDDDFSASVSDLDGSERSTDENSSEDEDNEEDGEGDDDEDEEEELGEEQQLDPAKHPLLRPRAMPKMSKAALEMAVGIIEDDLMGGSKNEADEDGEDELDDED